MKASSCVKSSCSLLWGLEHTPQSLRLLNLKTLNRKGPTLSPWRAQAPSSPLRRGSSSSSTGGQGNASEVQTLNPKLLLASRSASLNTEPLACTGTKQPTEKGQLIFLNGGDRELFDKSCLVMSYLVGST